MLLGKAFGGENQRRGLRLATEQQRCGKSSQQVFFESHLTLLIVIYAFRRYEG